MLNWLSISTSIWILLSRFGKVGLGEMLALIGMAWLLNYLPMRPGMVGRVAYHKAVNKISVKQSGQALAEGVAITGVAAAVLLVGSLLLRDVRASAAWALLVAVPMAASALGALALWHRRPVIARYLASGSLRVLDMAVWAGRYAVAFEIVGASIDLPAAIILAVASQAAMFVPIAGNGLGLREWIIGALAAGLPAAMLGGADANLGQGLTADVLNRVVEVMVAVPLGLICLAVVLDRVRRLRRSRAGECPPPDLP